jgi:hypothetical protein
METNGFAPFGKEWEKEMLKFTKCQLIEMLKQKQNGITFKNVSSNILHDDKGEQSLINLYMPIKSKDDLELADRIYKKDGTITVKIFLDNQ